MQCSRCNTKISVPFVGVYGTFKLRTLCESCFYRLEFHKIQRRIGITKAREYVKNCLAGDYKKAFAVTVMNGSLLNEGAGVGSDSAEYQEFQFCRRYPNCPRAKAFWADTPYQRPTRRTAPSTRVATMSYR